MSSKHPRRPVDLEGMLLQTQAIPPKPFENRIQLYTMHFFFAFVSRMWDMGLVLLVAQLTNNSLFLVAATGLICALSVFLFMGSIGQYLDRTNRIVAVRLALFAKVLFVTIAYSVCAYLSASDAAVQPSLSDKQRQALLYSIPLLGALAGLSFNAITQSIEKDWIVVLAAKDSAWLSTTNSILTQIDLGCSSLAPLVTGTLFAHLSHSTAAVILLVINGTSSIALYFYMDHLYHAWPALGQKVGVDVLEAAEELLEADSAELEDPEALSDDGYVLPAQAQSYGATASTRVAPTVALDNVSISTAAMNNSKPADGKSRLSVRSAAELAAKQSRRMSADAQQLNKSGTPAATTGAADDTPWCGTINCAQCCGCVSTNDAFKDFLQSGCAGMMVSYAFLFLTVLSFGSLMTVYLRWAGIRDDMVGLYRGLAALCGYSGAVVFPYLSAWLGLWQTAQLAIAYQFSLIALAASGFYWADDSVTVYLIIGAVLFSRTGLWLFDLCVRQIAQETIPELVRGKVNGQWRSMTAFFEMASYAAAVALPDAEHFWVLTTISAAMVGLALLTFTVTNPVNAKYCGCCTAGPTGTAAGLGPVGPGGGVRIGPLPTGSVTTNGTHRVKAAEANAVDSDGFAYRSAAAAAAALQDAEHAAVRKIQHSRPHPNATQPYQQSYQSQYQQPARREMDDLDGVELQPGTNIGRR